jgi:UDP-GlcNAc:undecaprenyl-phosphate/decaprenyl-phosphate GlcNAc-1-phosphate transferase
MKSFLAAFVLALVASLAFTPMVRAVALSKGFVARNGWRHVHASHTPRIGGLALCFSWCLALIAFLPFEGLGADTLGRAKLQLVGVSVGALALCCVGAIDDLRGLRVAYKLTAQVLAACFAYYCGFRIDAVSLPFLGTLQMGAFALPVTCLWIVGVTNAVNLIDGLDGLAAGVSLVAAITGFVMAVMNGSPLVAMALAALIGVLAGFLVYNFNPARIFMGDSGSYFLGYVLATTSLTGALQQKASTAVSLLVPAIALGLPIFDTLFSMLRRYLEKRPIFAADRGHIHHRLLELGLTHRRTVVLLYAVSVVFAACAIMVSFGGGWVKGGAMLGVTLVVVGLMRVGRYFDYLHNRGRSQARIYDGRTERLRRALPEVIASLSAGRSEDDVLRVLGRVTGDAGCAAVLVRTVAGVAHRFPLGVGDLDHAGSRLAFPLGPEHVARAEVEFVWQDDDETSVQATILLQIVSDEVANALKRCMSPLAALPEAEHPVSNSPPAAAAMLPSSSRA